MKIALNTLLVFVNLALFTFCSGQTPKTDSSKSAPVFSVMAGDTVTQIDGEIRGIFQDSKDNVWFASNGNGVYRYDGKAITRFTEKHGLCSNYVWMVQEGKDGNMWFKTNVRPRDVDAICCFNGSVFKTVRPETDALYGNLLDGELLFDYFYDGTWLSKIQLPHTSPIKNELNRRHHYDIYSTCKDSKGNLWFGTATAGICKYDGNTFTWFAEKELGAAVRSIYEDRNGAIWAGNNGDGLFRYDAGKFTSFSREKGLHNPDFEKYPIGRPGLLSRVWSITEDEKGNLWAGTIDNGAWMYDGKKVTNYTTRNGLGIDAVWVIYKDKKGRLWFGTEGDGVYNFDGKEFKKFKLAPCDSNPG